MYEVFEMLLKQKGIKAADVCRATGIKSPVFSEWKKGKSRPNTDKMIKIAKFLDVSVEYLMTGEENRLSERNADLDYMLLTDNDSRGILIEYQNLDSDHKKMLKKYLDFLKNDMI